MNTHQRRADARHDRVGRRWRPDEHSAPSDIEHKAPVALAPRPDDVSTPADGAVSVDPARTTVTMVAAVTGTRDEVGDVIVPGTFTRKLRERVPKVCRGHSWNESIGRIVSIKELLRGAQRVDA